MSKQRHMRRRLAPWPVAGLLVAAAFAAMADAGCDPLVGGACAGGYVEREAVCVPGAAGAGGAAGSGSGGLAGQGGESLGGAGGEPANGGAGGGCPAPLAACIAGCVDLSEDPHNCGSCGHACATEVCVAGVCSGGVVGHVMLIGIDYVDAALGSPQAVLLGNALLQPPHQPLRLCDYRKYTPPAAAAHVSAILADEAFARGRTVALTHATEAAELSTLLATDACDAVLIHHQTAKGKLDLGALGAAWAPAFATFLAQGGSVVVLASDAHGPGAAEQGGMAALVDEAGLLSVAALASHTGELVYNQGLLDVLGQGVLAPFLAKLHTASFVTSEMPGPLLSFVATTADGEPVAIHRAVP